MKRRLILKFTKWLVRKYFSSGLTAVWGTNSASDKIIAWEWRFYDEKYELERNVVSKNFLKPSVIKSVCDSHLHKLKVEYKREEICSKCGELC